VGVGTGWNGDVCDFVLGKLAERYLLVLEIAGDLQACVVGGRRRYAKSR